MLTDPSRVDAMVADGFSLFSDQDIPSALMMAERCLKLDPNHARAWHLLAVSHYQWLEVDEALKAFSRAIECDRREPLFYFGRGRLHLEQNRLGQAEEDLGRALQIQPEMTIALSATAQCAQRSGNFALAASYLERCCELEPDEPFHARMLYSIYLELAAQDWPENDEGDAVPTAYQHIVTAKQYVRKIEQLPSSAEDETLQSRLKSLREILKESEKRRFTATPWPGALALLLGSFFLFAGATLLGYSLVGGGALYYFALRPPKYDLNRRMLAPHELSRFDDYMDRLYNRPPDPDQKLPIRFVMGFLRALTVPVMAVWALFENYDVADFLRLEADRLRAFVEERLLDDPILHRFRSRPLPA